MALSAMQVPGRQASARELEIQERNAVLVRYMPLVRYVAKRIVQSYGVPSAVELSDLVSWGLFGLVEAYERFDEDRGVKFETFAIPRIRGAIVDELRHYDWVPRNVRRRARRLSDTNAQLTSRLGREPTREEIAQDLGIDKLEDFEKRGTPVAMLALEDLVARQTGDSVAIRDTLADPSVELPGAALEADETRRRLIASMDSLDERDRLVLTLYYFENVPLTDVARMLGVTESRVSQLHGRALHALRRALSE